MKKLLIAVSTAALLLASSSSAEVNTKQENEAYVSLFLGASLAALLVMATVEDDAESD